MVTVIIFDTLCAVFGCHYQLQLYCLSVCSAYNLTRIGEVMWIEKDGIFGPNLSEEKVFPDDEVEPDVTVIVDYCTEW